VTAPCGRILNCGARAGEHRQRSAAARYDRHDVMEVSLQLFFVSVVLEMGCFSTGERVLGKHSIGS
jgi:hypothetical protein